MCFLFFPSLCSVCSLICLLSLSFQTMLANNNKSVAVSGGHIPSYNSNRWAILNWSFFYLSLSICTSVSSSCVSPVCPTALEFSPSQTFVSLIRFKPGSGALLLVLYLESWMADLYLELYSHVLVQVVAIVELVM